MSLFGLSLIIFKICNPQAPTYTNISLFLAENTLDDSMASSLTLHVTDEEIKSVVYSGASSFAPGPDEFNFHFYKIAWHIIGPTLCKAI